MTTKFCNKCNQEKDESCFSRRSNTKCGLQSFCKDCNRSDKKRYMDTHHEQIKLRSKIYFENNKDTISKKQREYYIKNKDVIIERCNNYVSNNRVKVLTRIKKYNYKNRERHIEQGKKHYISNKDEYSERNKKYRSTPKGKAVVARTGHKRRTKIKSFKNDLTSRQWDKIIEMQNNKCPDCRREFGDNLKPKRDHIYPVSCKFSLIGGLTFGNVQALCSSCNSRKGTSTHFMKAVSELII